MFVKGIALGILITIIAISAWITKDLMLDEGDEDEATQEINT